MRDLNTNLLLWLRSFERVAEAGGVTRAADALCLTPSAVSQHIRNLEEELGLRLFRRERGKPLVLEVAGEALLLHARIILGDCERLAADMRLYSGRAEGVVRFGVLPGLFRRALRTVQDFRAARPDIQVSLSSASAKSSRADLLGGRLDAAVLFRQAAGPPLRGEPLFRSPLVLVTPPPVPGGYEADPERAPVQTLDELKKLPFPVLTNGRHSPGHVVFLRAGFAPDRIIHMDSSLHAVEAARMGVGATIVATASLPEQRDGVVVYPLGPEFPANEVVLARREDSRCGPAVEGFWLFLQRAWTTPEA